MLQGEIINVRWAELKKARPSACGPKKPLRRMQLGRGYLREEDDVV